MTHNKVRCGHEFTIGAQVKLVAEPPRTAASGAVEVSVSRWQPREMDGKGPGASAGLWLPWSFTQAPSDKANADSGGGEIKTI